MRPISNQINFVHDIYSIGTKRTIQSMLFLQGPTHEPHRKKKKIIEKITILRDRIWSRFSLIFISCACTHALRIHLSITFILMHVRLIPMTHFEHVSFILFISDFSGRSDQTEFGLSVLWGLKSNDDLLSHCFTLWICFENTRIAHKLCAHRVVDLEFICEIIAIVTIENKELRKKMANLHMPNDSKQSENEV